MTILHVWHFLRVTLYSMLEFWSLERELQKVGLSSILDGQIVKRDTTKMTDAMPNMEESPFDENAGCNSNRAWQGGTAIPTDAGWCGIQRSWLRTWKHFSHDCQAFCDLTSCPTRAASMHPTVFLFLSIGCVRWKRRYFKNRWIFHDDSNIFKQIGESLTPLTVAVLNSSYIPIFDSVLYTSNILLGSALVLVFEYHCIQYQIGPSTRTPPKNIWSFLYISRAKCERIDPAQCIMVHPDYFLIPPPACTSLVLHRLPRCAFRLAVHGGWVVWRWVVGLMAWMCWQLGGTDWNYLKFIGSKHQWKLQFFRPNIRFSLVEVVFSFE